MSARLGQTFGGMLLLSLGLHGGTAAAQAPAETSATTGQPGERVGPADHFGKVGDSFQITAGTGEDAATLTLERNIRSFRSEPRNSAVRDEEDSLALVITTPLNDDEEGVPLSLDGLAGGTRATIRWRRFVSFATLSTELPGKAAAIWREAQAECRSKLDAPSEPSPIPEENPLTLADCDSERARRRVISTFLRHKLRRFNAALIPADAYDFGIEVTAGFKKFEFVDPATLAPSDDRKFQWSAKAAYTRYLRLSKTAVTGSIAYSQSYKAADEQIFCPPNPTNVVIACTTASGARPEKDKGLLLSAGLRHQLTDRGILKGIAMAPTVTYDALDDVASFDIPVYFVRDKDGGLTGGVRFGYRSDTDKVTFGIFIGAAFSILQ